MTDSRAGKVADALVTAINAAASGFSITTFNCRRDWQPVVDLADLSTLQMRVIPGPVNFERVARDANRGELAVVISVQQQATTTSDADALDYFAEEVSDFVGVTGSSAPQRPDNAVYMRHELTDADRLGGVTLPQFCKLIRLTYQLFT